MNKEKVYRILTVVSFVGMIVSTIGNVNQSRSIDDLKTQVAELQDDVEEQGLTNWEGILKDWVCEREGLYYHLIPDDSCTSSPWPAED